jgi:hypothetical protein
MLIDPKVQSVKRSITWKDVGEAIGSAIGVLLLFALFYLALLAGR